MPAPLVAALAVVAVALALPLPGSGSPSTGSGADRPTVAGLSVDGEFLYWLETGPASSGGRLTSVWRAGLAGGAAAPIAGRCP